MADLPGSKPPKPLMPPKPPGFATPPSPRSALDDDKTDPGIQVPPAAAQPSPRKTTQTGLRAVPDPQPLPPAPSRMPALGPLDALMNDPSVTEIMINDTRNVMIERDGRLAIAEFRLQDLEELNRLVRAILDTTGRILAPDSPYLDVLLPDGSRANIVGPPITVNGPCLTIRKFPAHTLSVEDLLKEGTLDLRSAQFLKACVLSKFNLIVSGGTGSGKTTLLNVLTSFIPKHERLVTIEDVPELRFPHANSVRMQTKPQTPGAPAITARDLVANALRMRPDRILVGECRKGEAFDMLQAMNTGHAGSMTTLHANTPRDALSRLETLCLQSGLQLPLLNVRKHIASAVDFVIQIERLKNGSRYVTAISEITGMEGESILLSEIFDFDLAEEVLQTTGFLPKRFEQIRAAGIDIPSDFFSETP